MGSDSCVYCRMGFKPAPHEGRLIHFRQFGTRPCARDQKAN